MPGAGVLLRVGLRCVRVVTMSDRGAVTCGYDEFFVAEFPRLVAMLTAWAGSRAVAEELSAQDELLQAQRRWVDVASLDSPRAWVRRVALNRSANEGRRRRRERAAVRRLGARDVTPEEPALVDDGLWARVRELSPSQRDAVVLRYVDDLPLAEIALVMGCTEGTVKTHLQRARSALAAYVTSREGGSQ
jgi:RNA polymerase sigma-70 factor, ECF subfamily